VASQATAWDASSFPGEESGLALTVNADDLAIVVIDVQPFFLDGWMAGEAEPLLARLEFLLALATVYDVPLLATFEQPIEKKGWLPERLEPFFPAHGQRHTKQTFNCCGEPAILEAIGKLEKSQIAVAGGETDVCVLQSVLGLIGAGKQVFLLEDALFSSEPHVGPAIRRMENAGAVPSTVKSLNYELRLSVASPRAEKVFPERVAGLTLPEPEQLSEWKADW
jgi:nicotinamidase-related amidase